MSNTFKFSQLLRIPVDINAAPHNEGGVYLIKYRFPTSYEFGLTKELDSYEPIISSIRKKIEKLFELSTLKLIEGTISDNTFGYHLRTEYEVSLKKIISNWVELFAKEIELVDHELEEIRDLVSIIGIAVNELPPLYVGIAKKQSIQDRIWQHKNGETGFAKLLQENGCQWTDLGFRYLVVPKMKAHNLRNYEKIIQSVTLPLLSKL